MHVSKRRYSRSRWLLWCAGLLAICAQAAAFFSCSFGTAGSLPVLPPPASPGPRVSISVVPATITLGQSALLSWSTAGVGGCSASGAWSGPQSPAGSTKVMPARTGTFAYVLNCSIPPGGSITQSATLTVTAVRAVSSSWRRMDSSVRGTRVRRTDLVADVPGTSALAVDPTLSDPWGLVLPVNEPAVVASPRSGTSRSYDGAGRAQPTADPLRLELPLGAGAGAGIVSVIANPSDGFIVSTSGKSAPARLIYASTRGVIAAWTPEVEAREAVVVHVSSDSAAYTALAIDASSSPGERWLYATDFRNGRIEVFDGNFRSQVSTATRFAFRDPTLPPEFGPFGIYALDGVVYVAYARRPVPFAAAPVAGAGLGVIDVFTSSGDFITRLVSAGVLDAPWALVVAPAGALFTGRVLLAGNTGDGLITAFDLESGVLLGALLEESGAPLVVPRLHGLAFGNDCAEQPQSTRFFSAGAYGVSQGRYGRLDPVPAPRWADR